MKQLDSNRNSMAPGQADGEIPRRLAEFFSAFADKSRIRILSTLLEAGELSVGALANKTGSSKSAVSHQLKLLRLLRLVTFRSEGRMVIYRLDDAHIEEILRAGLEHLGELESP